MDSLRQEVKDLSKEIFIKISELKWSWFIIRGTFEELYSHDEAKKANLYLWKVYNNYDLCMKNPNYYKAKQQLLSLSDECDKLLYIKQIVLF